MRLAGNRIHAIVWSEDLLAELGEKWREGRAEGKRDPSDGAAAAALDGIRRTSAGTCVDRQAYEHLTDGMPGNEEDDKPHIATAKADTATRTSPSRPAPNDGARASILSASVRLSISEPRERAAVPPDEGRCGVRVVHGVHLSIEQR